MINLLRFEYIKNLSKKHYLLLLLLVVLIVSLFALVNAEVRNSTENLIIEHKTALEYDKSALAQLPNIKETDKIREILSKQVQIKEEQIASVNNGDWRRNLELQNEYEATNIEGMKSGNIQGSLSLEEIELEIKHNKEFLSRDIEPFLNDVGNTGYAFLYTLLDSFYGLLGILFFSLFFSGVLSSEIEKRTIHLMLAQPISKMRLLTAKYLFSFLVSIVLIVFVILFAFSLASIINGVGEANYPMLSSFDNHQFIGQMEIITKGTVMFLLLIIFTITLIFFLSILFGNGLLSLILTIILFILGSAVFPDIELLSPISSILPFSYVNVFDVINGAHSLDYGLGITTLLISIILITTVTYLLFYRRETL